jgi:hypothetical protein
MATATNPLLSSLIPGSNPTGNTLTVPYGAPSAPAGANPLMPAVPSGTTSNTATNPYSGGMVAPVSVSSTSPGGAVPSSGGFAANSGPFSTTNLLTPGATTGTTAPPSYGSTKTGSGATGVSPTGAALGIPTTNEGENKTLQNLNKTFGAGLGTAIYNFLAGGAGFNQDAINNMLAAMQPGFNQANENLVTQFGSTGNRFSSGAEIGLADQQSQQVLDEGQVEASMYEQSVNDFIGVLMTGAQLTANRKAQPTFLDQLLSGAQQAAAAVAGGEASK